MTFGKFFNELSFAEQHVLAKAANTSRQNLYMIASGRRNPGVVMCAKLLRADKRLTHSILRPELYD